MNTIATNIRVETLIQKSKFICDIYKITSLEEIKFHLEEIKKIHKDATHYCFAYIMDNHKRCSDDGEPNGTAGVPILTILEKEQITNVLCIVTRYFGGIKLGAGGLVRAYAKSVKNALEQSEIIPLQYGKKITIVFPYPNEGQITHLLKDDIILDKIYQENISYTLLLSDEKLNELQANLQSLTTSFIIKENITL